MIRRLAQALAATWVLAGSLAVAGTGAAPPAGPPASAPVDDCAAPAPPEAPPAAGAPRDHGFLWRISKAGHDSWLFGTLHVGRSDWALPGPTVLAAMKASDTVALEIDALAPGMQERLARSVAAQPQTPLPPGLAQRLDRAARAECVDPAALAGLAPELKVAMLTTRVGRRDGLDPDLGADLVLARWGHATGRDVVSLETPEQQLSLLLGDSVAETVAFVEDAVNDLESGRAGPSLRHIASVWADGDWNELSDYRRWCDCLRTAGERAAMARLLDARNPGLADAIAALHAGGRRVFAAVGSLHMIGAQGLPAQMSRRGYRVERIAIDRPGETRP